MKQHIVEEIISLLSDCGINPQNNSETDIFISNEFVDTAWSSGSKKISYSASIFIDEQSNTVYMYEKTTESGHGFSFGADSDSTFQSGTTLFRKVKSVRYGPDGKAYEYSLDLGSIPKAVKETAKKYGYKFKTVLSKSKAQYPPGYVPPMSSPAFTTPLQPYVSAAPADAHTNIQHSVSSAQAPAGTGQAQSAFCSNCGKPIRQEARFCKECGKPVAAVQATQVPFSPVPQSPVPPQPVPPQPVQPLNVYREAVTNSSSPEKSFQANAKSASGRNGKGVLGWIGLALLAVVMIAIYFIMDVSVTGWVAGAAVLIAFLLIIAKASRKGCLFLIILWVISLAILFFILVFFSNETPAEEHAVSQTESDTVNGSISNDEDVSPQSEPGISVPASDDSISNPYRITQYYRDCTLTLVDPEFDYKYDLGAIYRMRTHFESSDYGLTAQDDIIKQVITDVHVIEGPQKGKIAKIGLFKFGEDTIDDPENYVEVKDQSTKYEYISTIQGFTDGSAAFFVTLENAAEYVWDGSQKTNAEYFKDSGVSADDIRIKAAYRIELHSKSGKVFYKNCTVVLMPEENDFIGTDDSGFSYTADEAFDMVD